MPCNLHSIAFRVTHVGAETGVFLHGAGSSPWGSTERLHALRGLLSIAAAEPTLLEALQPAVQGWLAVGAAGSAQGDTLQRHLILGALTCILLPCCFPAQLIRFVGVQAAWHSTGSSPSCDWNVPLASHRLQRKGILVDACELDSAHLSNIRAQVSWMPT